jgi:hypothetical protein
MEQLTMRDILRLVYKMQREGMSMEEIASLPVYLGDDEEFNGAHNGWCAELIDANNMDCEYIVELINSRSQNIELNGKAVLIS